MTEEAIPIADPKETKTPAVDKAAQAAEKVLLAAERAQAYKLRGYHCSESIMRACAEALDVRLSDDLLRASCGFRGGGGGYMDRCGVLEAGCMLIGYLYGRLTPEQADWGYSYLVCVLHDRFKEHFGSIYCRDVMPPERAKDAPVCIRVYAEGAEVVMRLLLEAQQLLDALPPEERKNGRLWFPLPSVDQKPLD